MVPVLRSANQTRLSQDSATSLITEGDASTHKATMEIAQTREKVVALQTVPLIQEERKHKTFSELFP